VTGVVESGLFTPWITSCLPAEFKLKRIPLHCLTRDVRDFPKTSEKSCRDLGKYPACCRLVQDFPVTDTSLTSQRHLKKVSDNSETFPETSCRRLSRRSFGEVRVMEFSLKSLISNNRERSTTDCFRRRRRRDGRVQ